MSARNSPGKGRLRSVSFSEEPESKSDIYPYQCILFLLTQLGYVAVAPSMLFTTFFEPNPDFCKEIDLTSMEKQNGNESINRLFQHTNEFHSLLMEWNEHCRHSPWTVWLSTAVMAGGIFGSFAAGFMADRFGRKPVVVVSMSSICLVNFLVALLGNFGRLLTTFIFFLLGTACGGYLVTNMVLLVEILHNSRTRLLVVSLNGWPLGMIGTALMAYLLRHWRLYHLTIGIIALAFSIVIQYFAFESIPWLVQSGKDRRAQVVQQRLIGFNSNLSLTKASEEGKYEEGLSAFLNANNKKSPPSSPTPTGQNDNISMGTEVYTYLDLFRHRSIAIRLITLLFCFGSSSIISFGLYFSAEVLPGSRYMNIAIMGMNKLALGFLPFLLSNCMGRRPILLGSIGLAMIAAWGLLATNFILGDLLQGQLIITALGLFMTGAIDPNWKIIHLLSIELFPTQVRNMARALCNVVARLGSLSGPWVLFLRSYHEFMPFWIFAVLLTIQLAVCFCVLPETRGKPLPDQMPASTGDEEEECISQKFRHRTSTRYSIQSAHSVDFATV